MATHRRGRCIALTLKQLETLRAIRRWQDEHGYSPTMRELGDVLGVKHITAWERVEALIKKSVLLRTPNHARGLSIAREIILPDECSLINAGDYLAKVLEMECCSDKAKAAIWKWQQARKQFE